ncbi:MAG: hypothetical protein U1F15_14175 [Burkholderiales bacterium]
MSHKNLAVAKTRYMTTMRRLAKPVKVTAALRRELANTRKLMRAIARHALEFDARLAALDGEDKLGNFEIQQLMSDYNQAESLASSIAKKRDCVADSIISKT